MSATATQPAATATFPERKLKDAIGKWWDEETSKRLNDPFAAGGTLYDVLTDVDSLSAVDVLLAIEPILGVSPPESVIKPGGYANRQDMIEHLLPALRKLFNKPSH